MYCKIIVYFESNIESKISTQEEEIATDEDDYLLKRKRLIDKWFAKICYHINLTKFKFITRKPTKEHYDLEFECKLNYINRTIEDLNKIDLINFEDKKREFFTHTIFYNEPELKVHEQELFLDKN